MEQKVEVEYGKCQMVEEKVNNWSFLYKLKACFTDSSCGLVVVCMFYWRYVTKFWTEDELKKCAKEREINSQAEKWPQVNFV